MKRLTLRNSICASIALAMLLLIAYSAAHACNAFYIREEMSGFNKICYYDHLGSKVAITIKSTQLCPLQYYVQH